MNRSQNTLSGSGPAAIRRCLLLIAEAAAAGLVLLAVGCQVPSAATQPAVAVSSEHAVAVASEPVEVMEFAPLKPPPGFDESQARLPLGDIPGAPDVPRPLEAYEPPQLPRQALRRMEEARRLFAEQRFTETIRELEQALRYNLNNSEAHRIMAVAGMMTGDDTRARHSAAKALDLEPDDLISHYVLGRLAEKDGRREDALRLYRTALKCVAEPDASTYRTLIHYYLGSLLYDERYYAAAAQQLGAFEEGLSGLDETADGNPELETLKNTRRGQAAMLQGRACGYLGQYDRAAEALQRAARQMPRDLELRAEFIRMLVRADRMPDAVREVAKLVSDSAGSTDAVRLLLAVHHHAGHPERGLEEIRRVLDEHPERVELWLVYADGLIEGGKEEQAVVALNDLLTQHPGLEEPRWKLIALQRRRQEWGQWLNALAREMARQPEAHERAVRELLEASPDTRVRLLDEASGSSPDERWFAPLPPGSSPRAAQLYLLGRLCDTLDRTREAEDYFEKALGQDQAFYPAAIGAASMYIRRAQWHKGLEAVEKVRAALGEPRYQLERVEAECHDGLDRMDLAMALYHKALELQPEDTTSRLLLGQLLERREDVRGAQRQYEKGIEIDGRDLRLREALVRLLIRQGSARMFRREGINREIVIQVREMRRVAPEDPATLRCLAMIAPREGMQQYIDILKEMIEQWPEETRTRLDLALAYFESRRYDEARETLHALLERDPYNADGHYILAMTYKHLLQYEQADEQYQRMLEIHPNRESWLKSHGELLMLIPDDDRAVDTYAHLLELELPRPRMIVYRSELMEACRRAGRFDEARRRATQWLEDAEATHVPLYRWHLLAADLEEGTIDRYLERCEKWLKDEPEDMQIRGWYLGVRNNVPVKQEHDIHWGLYDISMLFSSYTFSRPCGLLGAERWDAAVTLVSRWREEHPDRPEYAHWLVETLLAAQRYEEAAENARLLLEAAQDYRDRLTAMAYLRDIHMRRNEHETAITTTKEMLAIAEKARTNPGDPFSSLTNLFWVRWQRTLASLYVQAKQHDNAVAYLNRLLENADKHGFNERYQAEVLRWLAFTYQQQDQVDEAVRYLRLVMKVIPEDPGINNDLGYTLADAGWKLDEAEKMIRLAVAEEPGVAAYKDSLGWVLYKKGDFEEARLWLERATAMPEGQDPVVLDHLGDAYWRLGRKQEAIARWQMALELREKKVKTGEDVADSEWTGSVSSKIEAAQSGAPPEVAEHGEKAAPEEREAPATQEAPETPETEEGDEAPADLPSAPEVKAISPATIAAPERQNAESAAVRTCGPTGLQVRPCTRWEWRS